MEKANHAIVLFDGVCNLCNSSVNFILDRDKHDYFRFGSLQSEKGEALLAEYSIDLGNTDSVVLIEDGKVFVHSTAALRIARGVGGVWSLGYAFIIVPKFLRDPIYKFIARNRYRWFGKKEMCRLPNAEEAAKFI